MKDLSALDPVLFKAAERLLRDHLNLSEGEGVLITTDVRSDGVVASILQVVASGLGANPMIATIPTLPLQGKLGDPYLSDALRGAMERSDCWIDLTHPYIAGSDAHGQALKAGRTRCLVAGGMDSAALTHLYGTLSLDELYELQSAVDDLIAQSEGKHCRVTDRLGTDVEFILGKASGKKPRVASERGLSYSLPGSCVIYPDLKSVRGRIVVSSAMHDYYGKLQRPLTLEVDGAIQGILEYGPDADLLDRALRRAGGGEYGYVIHFSVGLHPGARFRGSCFVEDIRTVGANAIGFGKPWWEPGGGENHPDGILFHQDCWIDGDQILRNGAIVGPPSIAHIATQLTKKLGLV